MFNSGLKKSFCGSRSHRYASSKFRIEYSAYNLVVKLTYFTVSIYRFHQETMQWLEYGRRETRTPSDNHRFASRFASQWDSRCNTVRVLWSLESETRFPGQFKIWNIELQHEMTRAFFWPRAAECDFHYRGWFIAGVPSCWNKNRQSPRCV
jgi:hypothetical protein